MSPLVEQDKIDNKWLILYEEAPTYQPLKRVPLPVLDVLKPNMHADVNQSILRPLQEIG